MESSPIHSTKQNKPDIKHGKETILRSADATSEIEFNIILNKSSTITQWGKGWGRTVAIRKLNIVTTSH